MTQVEEGEASEEIEDDDEGEKSRITNISSLDPKSWQQSHAKGSHIPTLHGVDSQIGLPRSQNTQDLASFPPTPPS